MSEIRRTYHYTLWRLNGAIKEHDERESSKMDSSWTTIPDDSSNLRTCQLPQLLEHYRNSQRMTAAEISTVTEMLNSKDEENWMLAYMLIKNRSLTIKERLLNKKL